MGNKWFVPLFLISAVILAGIGSAAEAARAKISQQVGDPYLGAILTNAVSGKVIFEDNADAVCYPASIVKLMMLLIIQEKIEQNALHLSDPVQITAAAALIGGSQVYLKEKEVFPIEDLLYALIIQSANDAAVALAIQVAGSPEAFVQMMQEKAGALGMKNTEFHSVHGLPPAKGQEPDISTPRDLARLAQELLRHPAALKYTSTMIRGFRASTFEMRSHNRLLGTFKGCDGMKTGYFRAGGYSIIATARRGGPHFIAVVAGAKNREIRDKKARELLSRAFSSQGAGPAGAVGIQSTPHEPTTVVPEEKEGREATLMDKLEQRGSFRFMDEDLRMVLGSIAKAYAFNITIAPGVKGKVSVDFKDVKVRDALECILESFGGKYTISGDIVLVTAGERPGGAFNTTLLIFLFVAVAFFFYQIGRRRGK